VLLQRGTKKITGKPPPRQGKCAYINLIILHEMFLFSSVYSQDVCGVFLQGWERGEEFIRMEGNYRLCLEVGYPFCCT